MKRIFLSHSSVDKPMYLEIVVKNLKRTIGVDNFVYDAVTFEEGYETKKEISSWLEKTDIFVLFISNAALESKWVQKEILEAKELLDNSSLKKIFPIIIDENITHLDERIPEWMREVYNIKLITRPSVAARKIYNKMIELIWEINPIIKERQTLFVGRNELLGEIEERLDSYDKSKPVSLIAASGIEGIGRRTILQKGLVKANVIKEIYQMAVVRLDAHQSIEDLIILLRDLGYGNEKDGENLLGKSQEKKIKIAAQMLKELKDAKEILLIIDEGAIVSPVREISNWFISLNELLENQLSLVLCVVSKYKASFRQLHKHDSIFALEVPELNLIERKGLFNRYCELINLNINREDKDTIVPYFTGLPKEIMYTSDFIRKEGLDYLKRNPEIITDFSDSQVSILISKYEEEEKAKELLALISLFDFISNKQLFELIDNNSEYNDLIEEFLATGICENLGSNKEYLCLNSAVKNYIRRKKFSIGDIFEYKLNKDVKSFVTSYESEFEKDVSEILFYAKKAITSGIRMEERFLIPSHFLKSMKELYDKRDRDSDVVILADRILNYENVMDEQIAREIRYFLCSSLARLKDTRFKKEVQNIRGAEHHFLFGFYYRHVGRDEEAVSSLLKAMESRANFARAKRELVLVYNNMEEYDKALELAKENYQHNRSNEYHIQAYFLCLSKGKSEKLAFENRKRTIEILLEDMKKIDSEKAKNMYLIMSAQYEIFMKDNSKEAEKIILEAYDLYPSDTYVLLCMFDIYERSLNIEGLNKVLEDFKKLHGTDRSKFHKDYLKCKAVYLALKDDVDSAHQIIRKLNISESSKKNLEQRIERNKLRLVK